MRRSLSLIALLLALLIRSAAGIDPSDIPADAPQDSIMAGPQEIRQVQDWARLVFAGALNSNSASAVQLEVRRQDHSVLQFGRSCIETPIRVGQRDFKHGLGTHASSEILVRLPADAMEFRSWVGIDNNADTGGVRGSVQFSVELGGREVFRTATLRGTNDPVEVKVSIPGNTRDLVLKTDTTTDGPAHDQADWADARIVLGDGRVVWLDEEAPCFLDSRLPFAFRYGGEFSTNLLPQWKREAATSETPTRVQHKVTWRDPRTSLRVTASVTAFKRYPAADWMLEFENAGSQDAPVLEAVDPSSVQLRTGYSRKPVTLEQLLGDVCEERSYFPSGVTAEPGRPIILKPSGGRSSSGAFPFFKVRYGQDGCFCAVGWSGQWQASVDRSPAGPAILRAGLEKFSVRLRPGEKIRTPRILLMPWKGDALIAQNRLRRLILFEYAPRQNGRPLRLPIALQCYDRYVQSQPDWGTEAAQLRAVGAAAQIGCDMHWLDAAWFEGGFPTGVGNWSCPESRFPNGLKAISDACHQRGLKFIVWFEPERVGSESQIAREHPEFAFGGSKGGLYKLSDLAARKWISELLSRRIREFGLDMYRNDFNMDPLETWRNADAPERQGMTETRYVEGLYALWDELLARHPGLAIDNCAGGGRRIDLETLSRSVPLWHSDTGCAPGHADWNQSHFLGLGSYVPLFGACAWTPSAYEVRSAATAGLVCQFAFLDHDFPLEKARASLAEVKANQKYWYGDFYPLTAPVLGAAGFCAYQLHRSDLNSGIVLAFRRAECPYPVLQTNLRGVDSQARYAVEFVDENFGREERSMKGAELGSGFELRLPHRGTSLLVRYRIASNAHN